MPPGPTASRWEVDGGTVTDAAQDGSPADGARESRPVHADRAELARRQAELVRALVIGAPTPEGFDAGRLRIAADALLRKRAGEAARHVPGVRADLGPRFVELFLEWARGRQRFGSAAEASEFVAFLVEAGHWEPPPPQEQRSRRRRVWFFRR